MIALASSGPTTFWYLTRATGWVALLLLTASVALGVMGSLRLALAPRWPRFAVDALHRDISLLSVVFLVIHIVTTVLDGFAPISLFDSVIPFRSTYRPLWLGLGSVSFDLILALVATSLVRVRLGYRSWRAVHWLAYAAWPVAVLHSLGTGTDVKTWWMLLLTLLCVALVLVAVLARTSRAAPADAWIKPGATVMSLATPIGIAVFLVAGPFQPHWAKRAGTPAHLLPKSARHTVVIRKTPAVTPLQHPFAASLSGTLSQEPAPGGAIVQLMLNMSGGVSGLLRVRMGGQPLDGGGLSLSGSQVDLSTAGLTEALQGQIVSLQGSRFVARLTNSTGLRVNIRVSVSIDRQTAQVTGTLSGQPA